MLPAGVLRVDDRVEIEVEEFPTGLPTEDELRELAETFGRRKLKAETLRALNWVVLSADGGPEFSEVRGTDRCEQENPCPDIVARVQRLPSGHGLLEKFWRGEIVADSQFWSALGGRSRAQSAVLPLARPEDVYKCCRLVRLARLVRHLGPVFFTAMAAAAPVVGPAAARLSVMQHAFEMLVRRGRVGVTNMHEEMAAHSREGQREVLYRLEPDIEIEGVQLVHELLRMPLRSLLELLNVISVQSSADLSIIDALHRLPLAMTLALQAYLTGAGEDDMPAAPGASESRALSIPARVPLEDALECARLVVVQEPPERIVYTRLIVPVPTVRVEGVDVARHGPFFVAVSLVRSGTMDVLPLLDGRLLVDVAEPTVEFPRIKFTSTSLRAHSNFRLFFQLMRFDGSRTVVVPNASCMSNEIEVVSHTKYCNGSRTNGHAFFISSVVPASASCEGNLRVAVIGSNFVSSAHILVYFGTIAVPAVFHDPAVVICMTPCVSTALEVPIKVTINGQQANTKNPISFKFR